MSLPCLAAYRQMLVKFCEDMGKLCAVMNTVSGEPAMAGWLAAAAASVRFALAETYNDTVAALAESPEPAARAATDDAAAPAAPSLLSGLARATAAAAAGLAADLADDVRR